MSLSRAACFALLLASAAAHATQSPEGGTLTADAYRARAWSYYGQKQYQEALFLYGKALMLQPRHQTALYESGLTQLKIGRVKAAEVQLGELKQVCGHCAEATGLARAIKQAKDR